MCVSARASVHNVQGTLLSARLRMSKEKCGSATHSCSGERQSFSCALVHSGSCWLYAMLMRQSVPTPLADVDLQVGKTMSIVPSRSMSANDTAPTPSGSGPLCTSAKPSSFMLTQIWKLLSREPGSSHTRKRSARQSPLRSTTALLCGFASWHDAPTSFGSVLRDVSTATRGMHVCAHLEQVLLEALRAVPAVLPQLQRAAAGVGEDAEQINAHVAVRVNGNGLNERRRWNLYSRRV